MRRKSHSLSIETTIGLLYMPNKIVEITDLNTGEIRTYNSKEPIWIPEHLLQKPVSEFSSYVINVMGEPFAMYKIFIM